MATGTLEGSTIASTYKSLLKVKGGANTELHATTHQLVEDGHGNDSVLSLAIDSVGITGSGSRLYFSDKVGEYISGNGTDLTITSGNDIVLAVGSAGSAYCAGIAGSNNTIFGLNAGDGLVSGADGNVAFGEDALSGTMTDAADSNTAVGYQAGLTLTSGDSNTLVGSGAGGQLTSGTHNAFFGRNVGGNHTTGIRNTALGTYSMNDTGAGSTSADSDDNTFVGYFAGGGTWSNSNKSEFNVGIGNNAMAGVMNGALNNVAVGYQAGLTMTSADGCTLVGSDAGKLIEDGGYNTIIGNGASPAVVSGENNTVVGYIAGYTMNSGDLNTVIGRYAGSVLTEGEKNTVIGANTILSANDVDREIVIGFEAVGQGTNTVTLGDDNVTAVYMAEDSGATVYCGKTHAEVTTETRLFTGTSAKTDFAEAQILLGCYRTASDSFKPMEAYHGNDANDGHADIIFQIEGNGDVESDTGSYGTGAADYAEYFESTDGSALPVGSTVVLENGKVKVASSGETPIGVVRPPQGSASVIGNKAQQTWHGKWKRDDYGGIIVDENNDQIMNDSYNVDQDYVPREKRDEWNLIGLLGQIQITKGQPVADSWVKMKDISDTVEMWLVK